MADQTYQPFRRFLESPALIQDLIELLGRPKRYTNTPNQQERRRKEMRIIPRANYWEKLDSDVVSDPKQRKARTPTDDEQINAEYGLNPGSPMYGGDGPNYLGDYPDLRIKPGVVRQRPGIEYKPWMPPRWNQLYM